jgi:hypothetical protein
VILLLCCRPDQAGEGRSMIASIDEVVPHLSVKACELLQESIFPSPQGNKAILARNGGRWVVSYNRAQIMQQWSRRSIQADEHLLATLDEFDSAVSQLAIRLALQEHDCLIVNNHRILHGREGFSLDGARRLKRIRLV